MDVDMVSDLLEAHRSDFRLRRILRCRSIDPSARGAQGEIGSPAPDADRITHRPARRRVPASRVRGDRADLGVRDGMRESLA